jgi:hypothetical protein
MKDWESKKEKVNKIIERDGYFCYICKNKFGKKEKPTIDHWIPLSKGGTWDLSNLRLAHRECNIWKGDRLPNQDGSVPEKEQRRSGLRQKRVNKKTRKRVCKICNSGRMLYPGQACPTCYSEPEPKNFPGWAKKKPSECDHKVYHCFSCFLGFTKRTI